MKKRARITISGAVQGVGFRPFVYRLATELKLAGWVSNSAQGVLIDAEGEEYQLRHFVSRLQTEKPPLAVIQSIECAFLEPADCDRFEIRDSKHQGAKTALILPDIATCADCLRELLDPKDRRYLYPFTNCTHCGPRFSIIEALPYDRANTSMKQFAMCPECEREYRDPRDRRFHAQPNACPQCGPRLELWNDSGACLCIAHDALLQAAGAIRSGQIVAVKGIGGFQLITDACNESAVQRLRARKRREEKPFALMFPSFEAVQGCCHVDELERQLLRSPAAPIVLVKKADGKQGLFTPAPSVAPGNPGLGVMVPYSPLHHLLLRALGFPVVATSGNLSDEPICTDEREALERLHGIADLFLVHNRPIVRHVDDSVVRVMAGREMMLRRARGYAPMPVPIKNPKSEKNVLAVGGHLKSSVALSTGGQVFISQHIGDLETAQAFSAFRKSAVDLPKLYDAEPAIIAHDLHAEYLSTKFAVACPAGACVGVQHHYAHILSCMAENGLSAPVLGVAWDGTGLGTDGTIWGGEFLRIDNFSFERVAHFRQFSLPGGEAAVKQPRRSALGLLYEIFGAKVFHRSDLEPVRQFSPDELRMLERMLSAGIQSPVTSSAGRFFDAMASVLGLRHRASFEGQGAMELEFASAESMEVAYPFELSRTTPMIFDWERAVVKILNDLQRKSVGAIAAKLHNTLVEVIVAVAQVIGEKNVVLSGGCFQNRYLTERTVQRLRGEGFAPHWHRKVPPNDGGIALGQVIAALRLPPESSGLGSKPNGLSEEITAELTDTVLKP